MQDKVQDGVSILGHQHFSVSTFRQIKILLKPFKVVRKQYFKIITDSTFIPYGKPTAFNHKFYARIVDIETLNNEHLLTCDCLVPAELRREAQRAVVVWLPGSSVTLRYSDLVDYWSQHSVLQAGRGIRERHQGLSKETGIICIEL